MRSKRSAIIAAVGAVVLLGALPACGGGGADGSGLDVASLGTDAAPEATTAGTTVVGPEDPEEAMLAYTECMRDHGVDMPDPQTDGEGRTMVALDADPASGEFQEAQTACEPLMDNAMSEIEIDPEREAEMREQLLDYAACMRDHGIDMPDPTFGENGRVTVQAGADGDDGAVNPVDDDDFEAANAECADDGMIMAAPSRPPSDAGGGADDGEGGSGAVLEMQTKGG
ncbi:MAG: hypothetical protein ABWZ99_12000 [Ilumatobacteraceae bacterium]